MQVFLKGSDAKRIFICGRIITASDNGAFEISENEYNANKHVFEPADKKKPVVEKPVVESADEAVEEKPKRAKAKKA